jgi:hypothetical protein
MGRAVRKCSEGSSTQPSDRRSGWGVCLTRVEELLETATDVFPGREDLILHPSRGEFHHLHRLIAIAVAARIGGCLVKRPEPLTASTERHRMSRTRTTAGAVPGWDTGYRSLREKSVP